MLQEDLLIHGDSVYDIIDKQDQAAVQAELARQAAAPGDDRRLFLCRMNVSRNARRQMRFGDQKVVLVQGHYLSFLPLCSRNEPVFLATCTPVAMPETRECVVQGATNVFTSIHAMDMKFMHIDKNGEFHLGYPRAELQGASWYQLLHWDCMREAQTKHRLITQSEQDRSCILLLRLQRRAGDWLWVHCVLQVKDSVDSSQQPVIVCTNQVLSDREAAVMRANGWLYHYYMVQSKLQYGLALEAHAASRMAAAAYYHHGAPQPPPAPGPQPETAFTTINTSSVEVEYVLLLLAKDSGARCKGNEYVESPVPVDYSRHAHHEPPPADDVHRRKLPRLLKPVSPELLAAAAGRARAHVKAAAADPADLMEQWNPSPPWSDTALQKVPDISHQELSPYTTCTPPTPSGTPAHPSASAFTFEWSAAGEQYVPSVGAGALPPLAAAPAPPPHEEPPPWHQLHQPHQLHHHRLFPLQPPPHPQRPAHSPDDTPPAKDENNSVGGVGAGAGAGAGAGGGACVRRNREAARRQANGSCVYTTDQAAAWSVEGTSTNQAAAQLAQRTQSTEQATSSSRGVYQAASSWTVEQAA
ncbi:neuronal PAS domain-containing protein 4 [Schistocerca nitens]|uniref:neuronal PAS domain-containing protein 4 n=1 Tax=Schistocerca nitens TaxID=7011 RepID=UPI0021177A4D|nr:neuronal PAS domain-containing protein 4 [Schistocerca nitens]